MFDNDQCLGRAFSSTFAANDTLERLGLIRMVKHGLIWAKADTGQTSHTKFLVHADDPALVLKKRPGRTDLNTFATLYTENGIEIVLGVTFDTNTRFSLVCDLEPGLGAGLFAHTTANAEVWIVR